MMSEFAEGELMLEIAKKWQVPWKCEEVTPMQVWWGRNQGFCRVDLYPRIKKEVAKKKKAKKILSFVATKAVLKNKILGSKIKH